MTGTSGIRNASARAIDVCVQAPALMMMPLTWPRASCSQSIISPSLLVCAARRAETEFGGEALAVADDLGEGRRAVNLRLAQPKGVQVGAIEQQQRQRFVLGHDPSLITTTACGPLMRHMAGAARPPTSIALCASADPPTSPHRGPSSPAFWAFCWR